MRRRNATASQLLASLASDPEHLARVAERDRRIAQLREEMSSENVQIAAEAAMVGYTIASVWDFVNNTPHNFLQRSFVGSYERAYPLLVKHLRIPHHPRVREGIIRALTVRDGGPFVASALLEQFRAESDADLKWVLANALKVAMPLRERKAYPEVADVYRRKVAP